MESFFIKRHIRPRKYKTKEKLSMNPLRYPGAKSKLFKYIKTLIAKNELNGCTFYEPFAGSATMRKTRFFIIFGNPSFFIRMN